MKKILCFLVSALLVHLPAYGINEDELLEPEKAFQMRATVADANTVRLQWTVAEGYYLYRSKLRVTSQTPNIHLGEPDFPPGKIKHDEFFGDVETYRGRVTVDIPLERDPNAADILKLEATSQGCADLGVCYPPQTHAAELKLPPPQSLETPPGRVASTNPLQAIAKLGASLGLSDASDEVLPAEEAFQFSAEVADDHTLIARWQITDGHYLYKDKFQLALQDTQGVKLGPIAFPPGKMKDDEFFGPMEVYYEDVAVKIPLQREDRAGRRITLQSGYQGCAERGICYPPIKNFVDLVLPAAAAAISAPSQAVLTPSDESGAAEEPESPMVSEQDRLAQSLSKGNVWLTLLGFFGFGLLLAFTPCVFPMIPILSSIIVGQGEGLTTGKAFTLSWVYVLAMALTYTVAGVLAGLFGANLQAVFQNPWILGSFAAVFVLLSLSMFGFYELQMPASIQSKLTAISNSQQGDKLAGVAIMGLLSALIVGPCVAPPLAGALIYIGQTGDAILGGMALFALSMGMGAPLLVIGTSAGKVLPKAGGWMKPVKAVFGVLLLAVAVWLLERILPAQITLVLWALLLIVPAVYMGALEPIQIEATGWTKLWKGAGLVMLIIGAVLIIGAASGSKDVFQPLHALASGAGGSTTAQVHGLAFKRVKSIADIEREVAAASAQGRPVMLDFYADWCVTCKEMERYTFSEPGVQSALANTTLLQADVTDNDTTDQALLKHLGLIGPPSILFYGADGQERRPFRLVGFLEADKFQTHVERAIR